MYRNEFTAKIGFTRVLDRTCVVCGGMYSSNETATCPKCHAALVVPSYNTAEGPRSYCFTEVTLYPLMRKEMKENHAKRTAAAKGVLYTIRMVLWGRYDKERNVVVPDPRTPYLVAKRTIRVMFNNPPTLIPFMARDGQSQKVEMKFTFDSRDGDQVEFLDDKQTAVVTEAESVRPGNTNAADPAIEEMRKQLAYLMSVTASGGVLPSPTPNESGMTLTDAGDYEPAEAVVAAEASQIDDPFVT